MSIRRLHSACILTSGTLLSLKVKAAEGENKGKTIKISELPIYDVPESRVEFVKEEPGEIQKQISKVRKVVWKWMESVQDTTDKIKDVYEIGKAHTQSTIDIIQNEPNLGTVTGVILAGGLIGVLFGSRGRGGATKKVFFGSLGAGVAAAFCYPQKTVDITKQGFNKAKKLAGWEE